MMNRNDIKQVFIDLSKSQGFYGRLLRNIDELEDDEKEEYWTNLEQQNFKDSLDLILFIEC